MQRPFADRREAGRVLAERLSHYRGDRGVLVLGLPRGGVPVAYEVAAALGAPLDVFLVRKLGFPGHELERREREYRGDRAALDVGAKVVILVDDGLATGSSMRAGVQAVRKLGPRRLVVAVPVAPARTCRELETYVDEVVCAATPRPFWAVGQAYADFTQTTDAEVRDLLRHAPAAVDAGR